MIRHRLTIEFDETGCARFYQQTSDPEGLRRALARLVAFMVETPSLVRCAAGACQGHQHPPARRRRIVRKP